jgi:hypothetical protein
MLQLPDLTPDQRQRASAFLLGLRAKPQRREIAIYDGRRRVGSIVVDEGGKAEAFRTTGKSIGDFRSEKAAIKALVERGEKRKRAAR